MATAALVPFKQKKEGSPELMGWVTPETMQLIKELENNLCNYNALYAAAQRVAKEILEDVECDDRKYPWQYLTKEHVLTVHEKLKEKNERDRRSVNVTIEETTSPGGTRNFLNLLRDTPQRRGLTLPADASKRRMRSLESRLAAGEIDDDERERITKRSTSAAAKRRKTDADLEDLQSTAVTLFNSLDATTAPTNNELPKDRGALEKLLAELTTRQMEVTHALLMSAPQPTSIVMNTMIYKTRFDDPLPVSVTRMPADLEKLFLTSMRKLSPILRKHYKTPRVGADKKVRRESRWAHDRSFQSQLGYHASSAAQIHPGDVYSVARVKVTLTGSPHWPQPSP